MFVHLSFSSLLLTAAASRDHIIKSFASYVQYQELPMCGEESQALSLSQATEHGLSDAASTAEDHSKCFALFDAQALIQYRMSHVDHSVFDTSFK